LKIHCLYDLYCKNPYKTMKIILCVLTVFLFIPMEAFSVTLEEAIQKAMGISLQIKEQKETVKRTEYSYISTIDPYLPRVDIQGSYTRYLNNMTKQDTGSGIITGQDAYGATGSVSYRLFDGGLRYAQRKGSYSLMGRELEKLEGIKVDVLYYVKNSFFSALGKRTVVEKRQEAYETAKKVYELTKARFEEGIARKSDVLQAEVQATTAMIDVVDARTDYAKSLEDLKSFLLMDPGEKEDAEGVLEIPKFHHNYEELAQKAVNKRPDVAAQVKEVERLGMVYNEKKSEWFPKIDAQLQQQRQDRTFFPDGRQDVFMLNFTFPLFDGVGRYYNMQGASRDIQAAKYKLEDIKRNVKLDIIKACKDYELSLENIRMYSELLRQAVSNFDQAIGEYKAGKGDILTLLQAEKDLAKAKENLAVSMYKSNNALAFLEKVSYWSEN
jgi:outer membrane protein